MGEPIADEEWSRKYRARKNAEQERVHILQNRLDGLQASDTWYVITTSLRRHLNYILRRQNIKILEINRNCQWNSNFNILRCKCGNCSTEYLQNLKECQCCHEIGGCRPALESELVVEEVREAPLCITLHPGFQTVCLNRWALRLAARKFKTIDGRKYEAISSGHVCL
jgi:hypothetical protein